MLSNNYKNSNTCVCDIKSINSLITSELDKSIFQTDSLIQDIIEFSTSSKLTQEKIDLNNFIYEVLKDRFASSKSKICDSKFKFFHQKKANIDTVKIKKVFMNIIFFIEKFENIIWIKSQDIILDNNSFIEIKFIFNEKIFLTYNIINYLIFIILKNTQVKLH